MKKFDIENFDWKEYESLALYLELLGLNIIDYNSKELEYFLNSTDYQNYMFAKEIEEMIQSFKNMIKSIFKVFRK